MFHAAIKRSTEATSSALLRACAPVTADSSLRVTLPRGSIKLELLLPGSVLRESVLALLRLQEQVTAHDEAVHLRPHEARVSLTRRADNRLAPHVERSVDEHGAARQPLELGEEFVVERTLLDAYGLHAR